MSVPYESCMSQWEALVWVLGGGFAYMALWAEVVRELTREEADPQSKLNAGNLPSSRNFSNSPPTMPGRGRERVNPTQPHTATTVPGKERVNMSAKNEQPSNRPHNPNCDGTRCRSEIGEVRMMPASNPEDGFLAFCRGCYDAELARRMEEDVIAWNNTPRWETLLIKVP